MRCCAEPKLQPCLLKVNITIKAEEFKRFSIAATYHIYTWTDIHKKFKKKFSQKFLRHLCDVKNSRLSNDLPT